MRYVIPNKINFYPFIKYNLIKKFFKKYKKKKNNQVRIYKPSIRIFKFFELYVYNMFVYNGKKFILFNFTKLKIFLVLGEFITTRMVNSGKILHKRKKK